MKTYAVNLTQIWQETGRRQVSSITNKHIENKGVIKLSAFSLFRFLIETCAASLTKD